MNATATQLRDTWTLQLPRLLAELAVWPQPSDIPEVQRATETVFVAVDEHGMPGLPADTPEGALRELGDPHGRFVDVDSAMGTGVNPSASAAEATCTVGAQVFELRVPAGFVAILAACLH